jgi:hypothetical protein
MNGKTSRRAKSSASDFSSRIMCYRVDIFYLSFGLADSPAQQYTNERCSVWIWIIYVEAYMISVDPGIHSFAALSWMLHQSTLLQVHSSR